MPHDRVVVGPGYNPDVMPQGRLYHSFWGVVIDIFVLNMLCLRCLPVMTVHTIQHAAYVSHRNNRSSWSVVIYRLCFYRLLGKMDAFAVIKTHKPSAAIRTDPTKAMLAFANGTVPRRQVAANDSIRQSLFQPRLH